MEIERKYRLLRPPAPELLGEGEAIAQGYLPAGIRIRRIGSRCFLTLKSEGDLAREEWEVPLPEWAFTQLWPETRGRRLEKRRYRVPHGSSTLDVDEYSGALAGLWTLECEVASLEEAEAFALPGWAADAEEVTRDARYRNAVLAERGLPGA
jgi:CYTH domain-containing protein